MKIKALAAFVSLGTFLSSAAPGAIWKENGGPSLRIEFIESQEGTKGKASVMTQITLFNTDREFAESGFDVDAMIGYLEGVWNAISAVLDGYPELGAEGLLIAIAVRPKSKVKAWCEAAKDDFDPAVLSKIETEVVKLRPPKLRRGTIAFSIAGPQWTGPGEGPPGFPKAWREVVKNSNKSMTIDEVVAVLWKD